MSGSRTAVVKEWCVFAWEWHGCCGGWGQRGSVGTAVRVGEVVWGMVVAPSRGGGTAVMLGSGTTIVEGVAWPSPGSGVTPQIQFT